MHKARFWTVATAIAIASLTAGQANAQVDAFYIGGQGNNLLTNGSNWVTGTAAGDWQRLNFGSAVVSGTLDINNFNGRSGIAVTSGLAQDMTIVSSNDQPLILGTVMALANIDMSAATKNLTVNTSTWIWSNSEWNVGSGATLFMNGQVSSNPGVAITKTGAGNAWITNSNNNLQSGGVNVNGGALVPLRGSLGTGPVVINNSGVLYVNDQWVFSGSNGYNVSYPNPSSVTVNAGGQLAFDGGNGYANGITNLYLNGGSVTGNTAQPSGAIFLYNGNEQITASGSTTSSIAANVAVTGNNNSVTVDGGSTLSMTGILKDNGWWGAGGFIKAGAGTFYLSGNNTYSGASTVSAGILKFANVAATGSTSGITANNAGSVSFDNGTAGGTITAPISLSGDGGGGNGALNTYTPGGQLTFSGPVTLAGGALVRADGNNSTINFTNAVSGTGVLVFAGLTGGGGTKSSMVLSGSSDFTGALSVTPWSGNTQVTLSGGDNRLPTTALVAVHGSAGLPGALDLNGNNQMIGGLTDSQGWGGLDAGARTVVNTSGTPVTLTLNTTSNQSSGVSIGGTDINGTVGNNLSVVKMGSATQTLSGSSSYTGATTITGGKLAVNGSLGSTAVSVGSGGTLGGSGSIAGAVSVDGILSPGNSPGVITLGSLLLGGSSTTLVEIAGTSRGTSYDGINITDSNGLTYGGILSLDFSSLGSPVADNTTFDIFSFLGSSSGNFSSVSSTGLYAGTWTSKGSGNFELVSGAQTLTFSQSAGDIVVVPEPTSLALLGVGLTMGVAIHRRRRRTSPTAR